MKKLHRFLYLLTALKFILPFFLQHPAYEPHRDEFLYLAEGNHPAFGYMEVPPVLSVFARLTQIMGGGMFWIKCWPSLFGALNLFLVGRLIIREGGKYYALFLAFCCFFFTGLLRVHFLFQPNAPEIFFYTLIGYGLVSWVKTGSNRWLYVCGLAAGFGMLSKYSVAFYLISLVPALLLTPQRKIFFNRHFYYAMGIAFLLFLPNALWQWSHHFPVVYHMEELSSTQLQYVPSSVFLINQFIMFLPCCFIWVAGFFSLLFNRRLRPYIFLCWAYLIEIALLLWFHGKDYYALGLYPLLFVFGCLAIEQWTRNLYLIRYILGIFVVGLGFILLFMALPMMPPDKLVSFYQKIHAGGTSVLRWEDQRNHPLPQDFADMLGWEEMARLTAGAYHSLDSSEKTGTIVFANNYGMAGAIDYYGRRYGLPEAYSDNASFLYWLPAETLSYRNFILITEDTLDLQRPFMKEFREVKLWGKVGEPYARENGAQVILMKGASEKFRQFFRQKINEDRRRLLRRD